MFDVFSSQRFGELPEHLKEHIREKGITFETEEELRNYVKSYKR